MPTPVLARSAAVLAALALGIAAVPELTEAAPAASAAAAGPAAALAPATVRAEPVDDGAASASARVARPPVGRDVTSYSRILPRGLTGRQVLDREPELVPELADRNSVPVRQMAQLLQDPTTRLSTRGRAYVVDAPAAQADGAASTDDAAEAAGPLGAPPLEGGPFTTAQTFDLQSRRGATRTIYLDFDGTTLSDTYWNDRGEFGSEAVANGTTVPGYVAPGAALTAAQHAFVQEVWRQVAESFAPYDVNVTTKDLGEDAWRKKSSSDPTWGSRVVITPSTLLQDTAWCGGCAGVAMSDTFGQLDEAGYLQPAWVFTTGMSATMVAQSVAHEVGHNLTLGHDGEVLNGKKNEYVFGEDLWGPIMGGAMNRAISQWSIGEYANATNKQDDLAIIAGRIPYVTDDAGGTTADAKVLAPAADYDVPGLIGSSADVDVFKLVLTCATTLDARVSGIGRQSELNLKLDLLSGSSEIPLASSDPLTVPLFDSATRSWYSTNMNAQVTKALTAGTYFLRVDGVGQGNKLDMTSGFSDYGSLGRYRLTSNGCATTTPPTTAPPTTTPPTTTPPTTTPPTTKPPTTAPPTTTPTTNPPATAPGAPTLGAVTSGTRGRPISVTMSWTAPTSTGGSAITGYKITAYKLNRRNATVRTYTASVGAGATTVQVGGLAKGRYKLVVQAVNSAGTSVFSATSGIVTAR